MTGLRPTPRNVPRSDHRRSCQTSVGKVRKIPGILSVQSSSSPAAILMNSTMDRKSPIWANFLWRALLAMVIFDSGLFLTKLVRAYRHPEEFAAPCLYIGYQPDRIAGLTAPCIRAGVKRDDRIVSLNGRPYRGYFTYSRTFATAKPGEKLELAIERDGQLLSFSIPVEAIQRDGDILLSLVFFVVGALGIALGFVVTRIRPADPRSWILLGLLLAIASFFHFVQFYSDNYLALLNFIVINSTMASAWPVLMALLGLFFPTRLPLNRWMRLAAIIVLIPTTAGVLLNAYYSIVRLDHLELARATSDFMRPFTVPLELWRMLAVGFFFACAGTHLGIAKTPEARRRAVLLNAGSHIALTPMFILVIRSMINKQDIFYGLHPVISIGAMALFSIFPLTLAYLVIVHRALDIRVVLRTGLQYALASNAVKIAQIVISVTLVILALRESENDHNRPQRIILVASAVAAVFLLRKGAERARAWTDKRFFREAYNAEHILIELSEEVRMIVETHPLLETVARRLSESLHVPQVAMVLQTNGHYEPAFALGYPAPLNIRFQANDPVPALLKTSRTPQTLYLDDPDSWVNRYLPKEPRQRLIDLGTQLLLPLNSKNDLLGFISMGPKRSEEPYSHTDLQLLRSVALQTGLALENSRLTATIAAEAAQRESLHREMEIARDVQQRLFPHRLPKVKGIEYAGQCRPAQSIGGDYYDFFDTPNGQFGLAIGDVSGKGVPAALLMAVLHASVRGQAIHTGEDLATLIGHVNRLIYDASAKSHFATLFYAQYDPATRRLVYVNAGHNPPLVLRQSGEIEWLKATGPGTGLTKLSKYSHKSLTLTPGDVLIAYTDGFTEAMNMEHDEFGDDRLLIAARAASCQPTTEAVNSLILAVDHFTAGAPQHDDMTAILIRVIE